MRCGGTGLNTQSAAADKEPSDRRGPRSTPELTCLYAELTSFNKLERQHAADGVERVVT